MIVHASKLSAWSLTRHSEGHLAFSLAIAGHHSTVAKGILQTDMGHGHPFLDGGEGKVILAV